MLQHIKNLLKDNIFSIAIIVTISIAYLSLVKVPKVSFAISYLDKWQHSFAYCTLTICWLLSYYKRISNRKYIIIVACFIYGIILELLQSTITTHRTGDFLDVLANTFGILMGLLIFNQISKKNQSNSQ